MASTIQATFGLDINPLKAGFNRASALAASAGRTIGGHLTGFITAPLAGISAAIGGFLTYETFKSGIEGSIEMGAELQKMSKQTGLAVGSLATLKGLFVSADVSADGLAHSIGKMQRNLFQAAKVGGPAGSALRLLKLDVDNLVSLKPEIQFQKIGSAIAALPSPLARTSAAMTIFGKSGVELLPVFEELGSADFGQLSQKAALLEKDSAKFHEITVGFHKARTQLSGVFLGIADEIAPLLIGLSKLLSTQNAVNFGQVLGQGIRTAASYLLGAFADPAALADVVASALLFAYAKAGNFLLNGLLAVALQFGGELLIGIDMLVRGARAGLLVAADALTNSLGDFKAGLIGIAGDFVDVLLSGMIAVGQALGKNTGGLEAIKNGTKLGLEAAAAAAATHGPALTFAQAFAEQEETPLGKAGRAGRDAPLSETSFFDAEKYGDAMKVAAEKLGKAGRPLLQVLESMGNAASKAATRTATLGSLTNNGGLRGASNALSGGDFASLFSAGAFGSLLSRNGLTNSSSALSKAAYNQSPLLTAAERRGFENTAVARGETRGGSTAAAFSAIRGGDHQRRRAEEKQRLIAKEGQEKGNELLEGILGTLKDGLTGDD